MRYHGPDFDMHDAWFLPVGQEVHAFHLRQYRDPSAHTEWPVGHIVSRDLLHWHPLEDILPPLLDPAEPLDFGGKFTGCAFTDPTDGSHLIYYTMRDNVRTNQRFGACRTRDLHTFSRCPENPLLQPDDRLLIGYETLEQTDWNIVDCRDLLVVQDPDDGTFYGYFAAAADVGRGCPVGVIAVAVSNDLLHWRDQSIVYVPRQNGVIEVPDVYRLDGKWVLTVLTGVHYAGRSVAADPYVSNVTLYAVADSPRGPFVEGEHNVLIGGPENSGYTCRTVLFEGKRYLLYVDRAYGGNSLSLPKEMAWRDGKLCALYAPLTARLRTRAVSLPGQSQALERVPTSFAWRTFGGQALVLENGYRVETSPLDHQGVLLPDTLPAVELHLTMSFRADAAGVMLGVCDRLGHLIRPVYITVEPGLRRLQLAEGYGFRQVAARRIDHEPTDRLDVRVIAVEGVCEVYLNDILTLQAGLDTGNGLRYGFFCEHGKADFTNVEAYAWEV